ncbi:hypothetical protein DMH18_26130 [Streptomyces sp. WAC 06783]|nr:hypothetical protein DMH18_26130 [Streptomyces sp. WAC 06783]
MARLGTQAVWTVLVAVKAWGKRMGCRKEWGLLMVCSWQMRRGRAYELAVVASGKGVGWPVRPAGTGWALASA